MKISKAVGIDLGTTRSLIGIMSADDRQIHLWRNEFGEATVPSVIQWDKDKKAFKVGQDALLTRHKEPYPIQSVKRQMGYSTDIVHNGKKYKPEQVSAEILKFLKNCGQDLIREKLEHKSSIPYMLDRAIITIPAYFNNPKIEATRKAAELAGLKTLELLFEPTAAAIYYCWKHKITDGNFLVYDLGGGTFDVSVLRRTGGSFDVIGTAGDNVLGGDTFDMALAEYIIQKLNEGKYNMDLDVEKDPQDKARFDYFVHRAEGIKKRLSAENVTLFADAACPLPDKDGNSINVELKITRPQFEKLIQPYVKNTIKTCYDALDNAKEKAKGTFKGLEDIDYILLVGGSTWIPYIKESIRDQLCAKEGEPGRAKCADVSQDSPDECVAMGATLLAASSGGIIYEDEEKNLSLHMEGASISADDEYKIRGKVFKHSKKGKKKGASPFAGYTLALSQDDDDDLEVVEIDNKGNFKFEEVIIEADEASKITLILRDEADKEAGVFSRTVEMGDAIDSGTAPINSQPIWIYAQNSKGERVKETIIETGASLPCERPGTFSTSQEDHVLFKIYQGDIEIKEASQEFEQPQPVPTKIEFNISMDTQGNMVVRSIVGNLKPFVMELEPPPPPPPPTKEDAEKAMKEFQAASQELPLPKRRTLEAKVAAIKKELDAALNRGDIPMANERLTELRSITQEISDTARKLYPPREDFNELVRETKNLISNHQDKLENADELMKNVDAQVEKGNQAYRDNNQQDWAECINKIKGQRKYVYKQIDKGPNGDMPPMQFLVPAIAAELLTKLTQLSGICKDQTLVQEAERHIVTLSSIPPMFTSDDEARRYIPQIQAAIKCVEKIERSMGHKDPGSGLPTLG